MGTPDRTVHRGAPPAAHHSRSGFSGGGGHPATGMASRHQRRDANLSGHPHRGQRRVGRDRIRIESSSWDSQTRWSYGDDQLPFIGRPFGEVILHRRVKRLHLPTPAASLHLRPPGNPPYRHPPSRPSFRGGGDGQPPRPFGAAAGGGKDLTPRPTPKPWRPAHPGRAPGTTPDGGVRLPTGAARHLPTSGEEIKQEMKQTS